MENPIKMDDLGGKPTIFGNSHLGSGDTPPKNSLLQAPPTASVLYDVSHLKGPKIGPTRAVVGKLLPSVLGGGEDDESPSIFRDSG